MIEVRAEHQLDIPVRQHADDRACGRHGQVTEPMLSHQRMRVFQRSVHVDRVREWRHECDDLWIAFHGFER
jgi:hypothetical protein